MKNSLLLCYNVRKLVWAFLEPDLRVDQALLTIQNQLTQNVQVFYTSDYFYKVNNRYIFSLFYVFILNTKTLFPRYSQVYAQKHQ